MSGRPEARDGWRGLARMVADFYRAGIAETATGAPLVGAALRTLDALPDSAGDVRAPRSVPAAALVAGLAGMATPRTAPIVAQFAALAPEADWQQNPNYNIENSGRRFMENYGYVEFLGPGRRYERPELRVGLLLLGPGIAYADHHHPAEEVYHVLAGRGRWWRQGEDWQERPVGAAIHHAPWVRHAMATEDAPMLALYCWGGDIVPHATLTPGNELGAGRT